MKANEGTEVLEQQQSWNAFVLKIFDAWWANHGNEALGAGDLAADVICLMPRPNRQYAARFVARHINRRVGPYRLESKPAVDKRGRPTTQYQLVQP
jgi:hypothetical protein